jgi:hypothetical protein
VASQISLLTRVQCGHLFDAHPVVVINRAAAHIRVALVDSSVDCRPFFREAWPTALGAGDHTRPDVIAHVRDSKERASSVGDAHLVPCCNLPGRGIVGMDKQRCGSRPLPLPRHVGEDRIQEVVIGGCDEGERVSTGQGCIALR